MTVESRQSSRSVLVVLVCNITLAFIVTIGHSWRVLGVGLKRYRLGCAKFGGLAAAAVLSVAACGSNQDAAPTTTRTKSVVTSTLKTPDSSDIATWSLPPGAAVTGSSDSFTAQVTRLACNDGATGVVLPPNISITESEVVVTFTVESIPPGPHDCPGNNEVAFLVSLNQPIGQRVLIDGGCRTLQARTTSYCVNGATRWRPLVGDAPGTTVSSMTITSSPEQSAVPTSGEKPSGCPSDPPFHATVLPTGFDAALKVGRAHQIPWDTTVRYYSGPPGAFIDIYPSELLAWRPATVNPLSVLNTAGQFGEVEDGYSASFLLPCGPYTLLSSGVTAEDFKAVLAGLTFN